MYGSGVGAPGPRLWFPQSWIPAPVLSWAHSTHQPQDSGSCHRKGAPCLQEGSCLCPWCCHCEMRTPEAVRWSLGTDRGHPAGEWPGQWTWVWVSIWGRTAVSIAQAGPLNRGLVLLLPFRSSLSTARRLLTLHKARAALLHPPGLRTCLCFSRAGGLRGCLSQGARFQT